MAKKRPADNSEELLAVKQEQIDEAANKALARSQLGEIRRGPSGAERAENNLYAQCSKERSKAGLFDFAHLVGDFSNFSFQDFEDEA